ncbi:MAG: hypothetical protein QW222_01245 [Candidatus Bathyarchaeia archaeon]
MKNVMIVSVGDASFALARSKLLYVVPTSYGTKNVEYLAFYRLKPISAITHYGKLSKIESNVHYSAYLKEKPRWMKGASYVKCYHLKWLKTLSSPIVRTKRHNAVIRPVYTDLQKLLKAKTLTDLFG